MKIQLTVEGHGTVDLLLRKGSYAGQKIALMLIKEEDGTPFATITVNVPIQGHQLQPGEFFIKSWSENEAVINALRKKDDIFLDTGRRVDVSQFAQAEIWKFANDDIEGQIPIL